MSYCTNIKYSHYSSNAGNFEEMLDDLFSQIEVEQEILRIVLFYAPDNNEEYAKQYSLLKEQVSRKFGNRQPALEYVAQKPLNASMVMEVHSYKLGETDSVSYKNDRGCNYVVIETAQGKHLFAGGWQTDLTKDLYRQAQETFEHIGHLLAKEQMPVNAIVRQWNYVEKITANDHAGQHYQMFNNARSEFYARCTWNNGYPAATGIGTAWGGIKIDLDAVTFTDRQSMSLPIDNQLQIAAHKYSDDVLVKANSHKSTPKFERARSLNISGEKLIYISGTAAIRGENSLSHLDPPHQLDIVLENIACLINQTPLKMLRVYLKHKESYEEVRSRMTAITGKIPVAFLLADVCREELLIEIEGIALT